MHEYLFLSTAGMLSTVRITGLLSALIDSMMMLMGMIVRMAMVLIMVMMEMMTMTMTTSVGNKLRLDTSRRI